MRQHCSTTLKGVWVGAGGSTVLFGADWVATKMLQTGRPQLGGSHMVPSFDIFKIDLIRDVLWQDAAESLAAARVSIEKLATSSPGEYLIFDQKTGQRVLVTLPGVSANPGSQAVFESILKPLRPHVLRFGESVSEKTLD